ncbi:hypothetical protein GWI33_005874 [Rhynchophorus ferrugineus]|uniref:Uncharacterized protein n=1 Tax=Rhynchophorus ferrugineus TaxID=354439 RepID=A0A834MDD1_RHYFE|nr:hypothetical protein GWI33_005874 [Rhynchophorus ferrugineus]
MNNQHIVYNSPHITRTIIVFNVPFFQRDSYGIAIDALFRIIFYSTLMERSLPARTIEQITISALIADRKPYEWRHQQKLLEPNGRPRKLPSSIAIHTQSHSE